MGLAAPQPNVPNNEEWSLTRLAFNIHNSIDVNRTSFPRVSPTANGDSVVKWNCSNHEYYILNVDGSCLGNPQRCGFGVLLRNNASFFVSGFSGYIAISTDILLAELYAIFHGLQMVSALGISDFVCYSDSLLSIILINGPPLKFHLYATLIQDIKDLLILTNTHVLHTLREGNYCDDILAKLGAASDSGLTNYVSPSEGLLPLIRYDARGTYFLRG